MATDFDLPAVARFTAGAIGEPGQRVFYLQATAGGQVVTLRCEKTQVAALAQYFAELLADLPAHAAELVSAGRPPCPLCGRPLDPQGHMCIKTNGHKTH